MYFYYALRCPGSVPTMYISTTQINQFNGVCGAMTCDNAVVIPTFVLNDNRAKNENRENATTTDLPGKLSVDLSTFDENGDLVLGLARRGTSVCGFREIRRPTASTTAASFGLPIYFKIVADASGPEILIKAFPCTIQPARDPNFPMPPAGVMYTAIENVGFGFQYIGNEPALPFTEIKWDSVTTIEANSPNVKEPGGTHISSGQTRLLSFTDNNIVYAILISDTVALK